MFDQIPTWTRRDGATISSRNTQQALLSAGGAENPLTLGVVEWASDPRFVAVANHIVIPAGRAAVYRISAGAFVLTPPIGHLLDLEVKLNIPPAADSQADETITMGTDFGGGTSMVYGNAGFNKPVAVITRIARLEEARRLWLAFAHVTPDPGLNVQGLGILTFLTIEWWSP